MTTLAFILVSWRPDAARIGATILPDLPWNQVLAWLAGSAVVMVPLLAGTFGLVALEAMAGGAPVVAFDLDNLPALIGDGGLLVPRERGYLGLWRAAGELLADPYATSKPHGPAPPSPGLFGPPISLVCS